MLFLVLVWMSLFLYLTGSYKEFNIVMLNSIFYFLLPETREKNVSIFSVMLLFLNNCL